MSWTTVYGVLPGEDLVVIDRLKNAWFSAPFIWDSMLEKYCKHASYGDREGLLLSLWNRMDIPAGERAVLGMTFDRQCVFREHYQQAAADIRSFIQNFPIPAHAHLARIAEIFESNPDYPAISFWWTTACEDTLRGTMDEETGDYTPIDPSLLRNLYLEVAR